MPMTHTVMVLLVVLIVAEVVPVVVVEEELLVTAIDHRRNTECSSGFAQVGRKSEP